MAGNDLLADLLARRDVVAFVTVWSHGGTRRAREAVERAPLELSEEEADALAGWMESIGADEVIERSV